MKTAISELVSLFEVTLAMEVGEPAAGLTLGNISVASRGLIAQSVLHTVSGDVRAVNCDISENNHLLFRRRGPPAFSSDASMRIASKIQT